MPAENELNTLSIAIVDDNEIDTDHYARLLKKSGVGNVHIMHSPEEALKFFAEGNADCLLVDYSLGATSGVDLVGELKQNSKFTGAVVLATGRSDKEVVIEAVNSGCNSFLSKDDISAEALQNIIMLAIRNRLEKEQILKKHNELYNSAKDTINEFRSKLNQALINVDLIKQTIKDNNYKRTLLHAGRLHQETSKMREELDTYQSYLEYIPSDKVESVNLYHPVSLAISANYDAISEKGIEVLSAESMHHVIGNRSDLTFLLETLISLSVMFSPKKGKIKIATGLPEAADQVICCIEGNGMEAMDSLQEEIFQPKIHHCNETEINGYKLAICKRILDMSCGRVWIESISPDSRVICLSLPAADRKLLK